MVLTVKALYVAGGGVEESLDALGYAVTRVYQKSGTIETMLGASADDEDSSTVFGMVNDIESTIDDLGLTTVANDARNARAKALSAYNEISSIKAQVGNIESQMNAIKSLMNSMEAMKAQLAKVSKGVRAEQPVAGFSAEEMAMLKARIKMPDFAETAELTKEEVEVLATDEQIKDLNNKVEEVNAMIKIMKTMIESTANKPVVEGWFETE